jgi:tRNA(Ile)-lysidine synthase
MKKAIKISINLLYAIILTNMLDKIAINLESEGKLLDGNLLVVGVSGGADSLFLLHALHALGYPLIAAHVNHGLRPEADQEAQIVKQFAYEFGEDFITCQMDVRSYACEHSVSIEEAARTMRYDYLFEQAEKIGASAVLVGHNADDQAETILMHLLRGSGLAGLRGMEYRTVPNQWSEHIPLVRPLLSTWREDILKYLAEHKLNPISDQSNLDTTYFRNRLRHELLPSLEKYNPRIRENLLRMGQITRDDYTVLQQLTTDAWERNLVQYGPGYLTFQLTGFRELPTSIQRYLLRKAIGSHLPGLRDVDYECIERGLGFLLEDKPFGQVDLIGGLRIIKERESFWVATWQADLPGSDYPVLIPGDELVLNIPHTLSFNNNWNLQAFEETDPELAIQKSHANVDPFQTWLDAGELELPMIVRCRKKGERIQPLGMKGHSMKVSDLMINLKVPKRARSTWPLVCSGDDILWIPGYRLSRLVRIKPDSQLIVHLTLSKDSAT